MYTLEERNTAVKMYIDAGYKEGPVINELGYPSPNALRQWYREYIQTGHLHEKPERKPRYDEEQQTAAVRYVAEHPGISLTQVCIELGYPTRGILKRWIQALSPDLLKCKRSSCQQMKKRVRYTQEEKLAAVQACMIDHEPDYRVAARLGVSKAAIWNWKQQFLGKVSVAVVKKEEAGTPQNQEATEEIKRELEAEVVRLHEEIYHLRMERDALEVAAKLLKKAEGIVLKKLTNREKVRVIDALKGSYLLKNLWQMFSISKTSYYRNYAILKRPDKYADLREQITRLFVENQQAYGYRRIYQCLKKLGYLVSEKIIRRLMKEEQLVVHSKRRKHYSSYLGEITPAVENLVQRNFHAELPNQLLLTDITEFAIPAGKVYLSPTIDCFDGAVIAWTLGSSPNADLANSMLDQLIHSLSPNEKPIIHSDRGCHYRWPGWIERMENAGFVRSMSRKGCSPDNAACEGFFGRLKNEMFYGWDWSGVSIDDFIVTVNQYIHWYNEKRIKESLGWLSPYDYRKNLGLMNSGNDVELDEN